MNALANGASAKCCGEGSGFLFGTDIGEVWSYCGGMTDLFGRSWKYGSDIVLPETGLERYAVRLEDLEEVDERSVLKLGWYSVSVKE